MRSKTQNFVRKVLLGGSEGKTDGRVCVFEEKTNHSSHTSWDIHELPSVKTEPFNREALGFGIKPTNFLL